MGAEGKGSGSSEGTAGEDSSPLRPFGDRLTWRLERAEHSGWWQQPSDTHRAQWYKGSTPSLPLPQLIGERGTLTKGGFCGISDVASV